MVVAYDARELCRSFGCWEPHRGTCLREFVLVKICWCAGCVRIREQIARGLVIMLGAWRTYRVVLGWDDRAEAGRTLGRSERPG